MLISERGFQLFFFARDILNIFEHAFTYLFVHCLTNVACYRHFHVESIEIGSYLINFG